MSTNMTTDGSEHIYRLRGTSRLLALLAGMVLFPGLFQARVGIFGSARGRMIRRTSFYFAWD